VQVAEAIALLEGQPELRGGIITGAVGLPLDLCCALLDHVAATRPG
jgi:hypothetical protein